MCCVLLFLQERRYLKEPVQVHLQEQDNSMVGKTSVMSSIKVISNIITSRNLQNIMFRKSCEFFILFCCIFVQSPTLKPFMTTDQLSHVWYIRNPPFCIHIKTYFVLRDSHFLSIAIYHQYKYYNLQLASMEFIKLKIFI